MEVVFLTCHDAASPRKVDFHFWAEALRKKNARVKFITVGCSRLTALKKNPRTFTKPINSWVTLTNGVEKYIWQPLYHPLNLHNDALNKLSWPLFSSYSNLLSKDLLSGFKNPDIFVVENGAGLMLVPRLAKLYPKAKFIYTVSDRLKTLDVHPIIIAAETDVLPLFHKIRVPAAIMKDDFPPNAPVEHVAPGMDKTAFEGDIFNPYKSPKNAISVGDMLFDASAIIEMAKAYPDWHFHLFGKKATLNMALPNVIEYGERAFPSIVPYLKHADIGMATYAPAPNADYLSQSSLKMTIYTYCRLPIVAPDFAAAGRPHVCAYQPGVADSAAHAFTKAMDFDRNMIDNFSVPSWDDVIDRMIQFQ